jgi:hypothetical protein
MAILIAKFEGANDDVFRAVQRAAQGSSSLSYETVPTGPDRFDGRTIIVAGDSSEVCKLIGQASWEMKGMPTPLVKVVSVKELLV